METLISVEEMCAMWVQTFQDLFRHPDNSKKRGAQGIAGWSVEAEQAAAGAQQAAAWGVAGRRAARRAPARGSDGYGLVGKPRRVGTWVMR
jgi:hypothetical protein